MRADFLERFASEFRGGFARLLEQGAVFTDGHQDHALTVTAAGHATIATGVYPARHGIVGNDFYDRASGRSMYCAEDSTAAILGFPDDPGRSPANLLRRTVGDWLKIAWPESKVYGVAIKDRAAIISSGESADGAYWYHLETGRFVTSAYYESDYPEWVDAFNRDRPASAYYGQEWTKLLGDEHYAASREDAFDAEFDGENTTFPHRAGSGVGTPDALFFQMLPFTPFAEELTVEFANELVVREELGVDEAPDILFLGLSSADYIGHAYGPYSQEIEDYYLRVDQHLEAFFGFLDEHVGPDHYVVVLSSDHGVMAMPEELQRRGHDAGRFDPQPLNQMARQIVEEAVVESLVPTMPRLLPVNGLALGFSDPLPPPESVTALRRRIAERVEAHELVERVFTFDELAAAEIHGNDVVGRFRRSFHPDRSPDLALHYKENYLAFPQATFTSHGSAHRYDTHVPIVFMGPGVRAGRHERRVRTVDIAPTLAMLLGISAPDDLDGEALAEATEQ